MANNKKLFLGNTVLLDLTGYVQTIDISTFASTSYVDAAVDAVDVSEQLTGLVEKELVEGSESRYKVLSDNNFTDALLTKLNTLANYDDTSVTQAIALINTTLSDLTTDSSTVTEVIDTFEEIKAFLSDYDTNDKLKSIVDAATTSVETWVGQQGFLKSNDVSIYLTAVDASTIYVKKNDVSTYDESFRIAADAIAVLDSSIQDITASVSAIEADYVKSNDVSTFVTSTALASTLNDYVTDNDASVYLKANDVSTKVNSQSVLNIVTISSADFEQATKDPSTLYIVL